MGGARRLVGREEKDEEVAVVVVDGGAGSVGFGVLLVCLKELSERRLDISCDCVCINNRYGKSNMQVL